MKIADKQSFPFSKNDVVLAKYEHELFYAKILRINYRRKSAKLLFDDESVEDIPFRNIYDVNETTSDIICVVCKRGSATKDNDIVLCDQCNVGFHQNCHDPVISSDVLKPEIPWECCYCLQKTQNPHIESNPFDDEKCEKCDEKCETEESKEIEENVGNDESFEKKCGTVPEEAIPSPKTEESFGDVFERKNDECTKLEEIDYGEQVVIAHADSTSIEENDDEDIIVDVESDDDCCLPTPTSLNSNSTAGSPFDIDRLLSTNTYVHPSCNRGNNSNTHFTSAFVNSKDNVRCTCPTTTDTFHFARNNYDNCLCGTKEQQKFNQKTKIHKPRTRIFHPYRPFQDYFSSVNSHYTETFYHDRYHRNATTYEQVTLSKPSPYTRPRSDSVDTLERSSSVSSIPSLPSPSFDIEVRDFFIHQHNPHSELFEYITQSHSKQCVHCGNVGNLSCSGCRKVNYCSRECQWSDWKYHITHCNTQ